MDSSFIDDGTMEEPTLPIELKPTVFRPFAYRVLSKKYGLNLQPKALAKLADFVGRRFGTKWNRDPKTSAFLDAVAKLWKEQGRGLFMDETGVSQVIKEIVANEQRMKKRMKERMLAREKENEREKESQSQMDVEDSSILDTSMFDTSAMMSSQTGEVPTETVDEDREIIDWRQFVKVNEVNHYTRFSYDKRRKQFDYDNRIKEGKIVQLPDAEASIKFYNGRLDTLRDRIYRNNVFAKMKYDDTSESKTANQIRQPKHITMVKNLLGRNEQRFVLFGLVTLNSFGIWQLQDDSDRIELVLKQCVFSPDAYFVSGNYLIVDGFYSSAGKFHVLSVAHPPAEDRNSTIDAYGGIDFSWDYARHGKMDTTLKALTERELRRHVDHKVVVLGGCMYLDDIDTMNKLKKVFTDIENELVNKKASANTETAVVYEEPTCIVFNGPFMSSALTVTERTSVNQITATGRYKAGFDGLARVLEGFPLICEQCKLVFVPGDEDPWLSMVTRNAHTVWPQMRIPEVFGLRVSKVAKDVVWASNPARMSYLSQDIAIVRADIGESLRRHDFSHLCELSEAEVAQALWKSNRSNVDEESFLEIDKLKLREDIQMSHFNKIVKTILDQGIVSPFSNQVRELLPNYWPLMTLSPLPHCLILCDTSLGTVSTNYRGCQVASVGKFLDGQGRGHYLLYYPESQTCVTRTVY